MHTKKKINRKWTQIYADKEEPGVMECWLWWGELLKDRNG